MFTTKIPANLFFFYHYISLFPKRSFIGGVFSEPGSSQGSCALKQNRGKGEGVKGAPEKSLFKRNTILMQH